MKHMLIAAALASAAAGAAADSYREAAAPGEAREVVAFWEGAGPNLWFAKDDGFDRRFRERFLPLHEAAARGELDGWNATPTGALALMVLLDQFPRNSFRGTPRMYATDFVARRVASAAVNAGHDQVMPIELRILPQAQYDEWLRRVQTSASEARAYLDQVQPATGSQVAAAQ